MPEIHSRVEKPFAGAFPLLTAIFLVLVSVSSISAEVRILPTPKYLKDMGRVFRFSKVYLKFSPAAADFAAVSELRRFFGKDMVRSAGAHVLVVSANLIEPNGGGTSIPSVLRDSVAASDEGYFLTSDGRGVHIAAKTTTGIFYAVTTLLQAVSRIKGSYSIPMVSVADYPSMKIRGISDDISRGQISTTENFEKIIRFLAMYKMNVYMPYIENEFAFRSYPHFSAGRAPLTPEEVKRLDEYAGKYHVQIIPIFETLGHMEDVLLKSEFRKYAEFPGATCLNVSSDSTYVFMDTLLSEIAPAFNSKYFNMAADETWDVGLGASRKLVDSVGIAAAHASHYIKIYNMLKSLGKDVMMYGDIILNNPDILAQIPKDITIVDWHYGAAFDYPSIEKFKEAGFRFIASPAVWNFTGPFPNFYTSYGNIQYFADEAYRNGALGMIVSTWNDNGGAELRELNYPGYAWGAECAWDPENASPADFEKAFFSQYFRTRSDIPRIVYELLSSMNNLIGWGEFWRSPFLPPANYQTASRVESIRSTMPVVSDLIGRARRVVGANRDILDIYALVSRMNEYFADRVTAVMEMRDISADSTLSSEVKKEEIDSLGNILTSRLTAIRKEYDRIYLRTNRHPMLQLLDMRFDNQEKALAAGIKELERGNSGFDQKLKTPFIYFPNSRPYARVGTKVDSATFVKTFDVDTIPPAAPAQLIGDTYCRFYVNGDLAGEVMARRTLTLNVENQRVKVFDIKKYLRRGSNTFLVKAINFDKNGSAGCNVTAIVGEDTICTDSTWQVASGIPDTVQISPSALTNAAPYDNGWSISAPDFSLKLKSWIER